MIEKDPSSRTSTSTSLLTLVSTDDHPLALLPSGPPPPYESVTAGPASVPKPDKSFSLPPDPLNLQHSDKSSESLILIGSPPEDTPLSPPKDTPLSPPPFPPRVQQRIYPFAPSSDGTPHLELSGDGPQGFVDRLKNYAPGKSAATLLDPPPACFTRPPAAGTYAPFVQMVLVGHGTTLDMGFPYEAPATGAGHQGSDGVVGMHPFAGHDVTEWDWRQFLHDVRIAGSLSPLNRVVSGLAPLALGVGLIFGFFLSRGVETMIRRNKMGPVSQLIHYWNHYFFHPRCIHVDIMRGSVENNQGQLEPELQDPLRQVKDDHWRLMVSYRPYVQK